MITRTIQKVIELREKRESFEHALLAHDHSDQNEKMSESQIQKAYVEINKLSCEINRLRNTPEYQKECDYLDLMNDAKK